MLVEIPAKIIIDNSTIEEHYLPVILILINMDQKIRKLLPTLIIWKQAITVQKVDNLDRI